MYKNKYRKYKQKYIKLKRLNELGSFQYTDNDVQYIDNNIRALVHCTGIEALKKILADGYIKSISLTSEKFKSQPTKWDDHEYYLVYASVWFTSERHPENVWANIDEFSKDSVCIIIDKNILFDKDAYFYINPRGEYGIYNDYETIPGPNIRRILKSEDMEEYVRSLDVNENIKKGLINLLPDFESARNTVNHTINMLSTRKDIMQEVCFIDMIDIRKYLLNIYVSCDYVDEVSKFVDRKLITCKNIAPY
jgi:hypothetical protein